MSLAIGSTRGLRCFDAVLTPGSWPASSTMIGFRRWTRFLMPCTWVAAAEWRVFKLFKCPRVENERAVDRFRSTHRTAAATITAGRSLTAQAKQNIFLLFIPSLRSVFFFIFFLERRYYYNIWRRKTSNTQRIDTSTLNDWTQ